MDNFVAVDERISCDELFHESTGFHFRDFFLDYFAEVAIAQLGDDVSIVLRSVDLVQSQDIGKFLHFLEDLNLRGEKGSVDFGFEHFEIDDLDCHWGF